MQYAHCHEPGLHEAPDGQPEARRRLKLPRVRRWPKERRSSRRDVLVGREVAVDGVRCRVGDARLPGGANDVLAIDLLVGKGADVDCDGSLRILALPPALVVAAAKGHTTAARRGRLLEYGADVDGKHYAPVPVHAGPALVEAVQHGHHAVLKLPAQVGSRAARAPSRPSQQRASDDFLSRSNGVYRRLRRRLGEARHPAPAPTYHRAAPRRAETPLGSRSHAGRGRRRRAARRERFPRWTSRDTMDIEQTLENLTLNKGKLDYATILKLQETLADACRIHDETHADEMAAVLEKMRLRGSEGAADAAPPQPAYDFTSPGRGAASDAQWSPTPLGADGERSVERAMFGSAFSPAKRVSPETPVFVFGTPVAASDGGLSPPRDRKSVV